MFLERAIIKGNQFSDYILGTLLVIIGTFLGNLPFLGAIAFHYSTGDGSFPTTETGLMRFLEPNSTLFLLLLAFAFGLMALIFSVKVLHRQPFSDVVTGRKKVDWSRIRFSFVLWAAITILSVLASYFSEPESFVFNFKPVPFAILFVIAVVMIPIQTSVEELFFRGYLMQGFALLALNRWVPLVLTSFLFGIVHYANPEVDKLGPFLMVYYIGTGLFLGITALMDDGLELALGFHAANNLVTVLLLTADWTAFSSHSIFKDISDPSATAHILIPVLIFFPILLFIFSRKYKWSGWADKLTGKITINPDPIHDKATYKSDL